MSKTQAGLKSITGDAEVPAPLRRVPPFEAEGLRFELSGILHTEAGVPGYRFEVSHEDGTPVGDACALITHDLDAIARLGHMGCEVRPEFRKRGYTARIGKALVPLARSHGIQDILITCGRDHETMKTEIREMGAEVWDELGPDATDPRAIVRFRLRAGGEAAS